MNNVDHTGSISWATPRGWTAQRLRASALALACTALAACAVGPDYREPPPMATGDGWTLEVAAAPADLDQWWLMLDDPLLEGLIETALAANRDLHKAMARIDEARALHDRVAGGRAPVVTARGGVERRRQSESGPLPVNSIPGMDTTQTIHDAGFDAAWELDLFGAKQRALDGAGARLQATAIEAQGVRMRVVAEVVRTWFTAIGAGEELRAQQAAVESLRQSLDLVRLRHFAGDASLADVDVVHAQWAAADAALPGIVARGRAAAMGLAVLTGSPPERGLALLDIMPTLPVLFDLPVGERADVLRRRPDVLAAERELAARTADIGVATAELFPRLSIGASGGFQALDAEDWFRSDSARVSLLPVISWRLFDGGRVRAEIRARDAAQMQAALAYEQSVLAALGDAERALSDYRSGLLTLQRREVVLEASHRSHDYAAARHAAGDIALAELLAAQRRVYEEQIVATRAHTAAAVQMVALYKALGGGWEA